MPVNHLTRIALPEHLSDPDKQGRILVIVPAQFYDDQRARSFRVPAANIYQIREAPDLLSTHGVYMKTKQAIRLGIAGCNNPMMPRKLSRS